MLLIVKFFYYFLDFENGDDNFEGFGKNEGERCV